MQLSERCQFIVKSWPGQNPGICETMIDIVSLLEGRIINKKGKRGISSSNVASLLLTHHSARSREIAMRSALGASRGHLIRQLFVESLLLGLAGCLAGCLLAYLGLQCVRFVPGISVPGEADMSLNLPVLILRCCCLS
jgi:hypothetical protein